MEWAKLFKVFLTQSATVSGSTFQFDTMSHSPLMTREILREAAFQVCYVLQKYKQF